MKTVKYLNTRVLIEHSDLATFDERIYAEIAFSPSKVLVLVDENVHQLYNDLFDDETCIVIAHGESSKTLTYAERVIEQLLKKGADRSTFLLGIGGGVTCDLTGFIASVFMRGIKFGFVPTTLLSMVDASIGGKNGVNFGSLKNMIGTINQPEIIAVNLNFLETLEHQELISGMAEIVKHGCIQSKDHFEFVEQNYERILRLDPEILIKTIHDSMQIKMKIVKQDERESGMRKLLNYGHTYGHAIEKTKMIPHGFAVSLGILLSNKIALNYDLSPKDQHRIELLLSKIGLPTNLDSIDSSKLNELIVHDKKTNNTNIDFILLDEIGKGRVQTIAINTL